MRNIVSATSRRATIATDRRRIGGLQYDTYDKLHARQLRTYLNDMLRECLVALLPRARSRVEAMCADYIMATAAFRVYFPIACDQFVVREVMDVSLREFFMERWYRLSF